MLLRQRPHRKLTLPPTFKINKQKIFNPPNIGNEMKIPFSTCAVFHFIF